MMDEYIVYEDRTDDYRFLILRRRETGIGDYYYGWHATTSNMAAAQAIADALNRA